MWFPLVDVTTLHVLEVLRGVLYPRRTEMDLKKDE
jgi:hypothetical protein